MRIQMQPASHPIASATETLRCTGHSSAALTRAHSPWVVWLLQVFGHRYINEAFLSSWYFCASMEKSSHQCSAFWNTLLKIEQIPNCRISDCWVPDSHCPSAVQSNAYALSSCFSWAVLRASPCFAALQWYLVSCRFFGWWGVQPSVLLLNGHKLWALRNQTQEGLFLTTTSKCSLNR